MKKVLIALDYDPTAKKVAEVGFSLAKSMNAEVILLHIILDPVYYASTQHPAIMGFAGYNDTILMPIDSIDKLKKLSLEYLEKSKLHLGDKAIKTRVEEGNPAESILKAAKKLHADIIVIGSHSQKWLENLVMGSVSEEVLRHTEIPVFIIPTKKN